MAALPSLTRLAWLSLAAAAVTMTLKLIAWRLTGSVGMLSDALETLANFGAALVALLTLHVSARPADEDHAYGHTKAEYFAVALEGVLIVLAAIGIMVTAWENLRHPPVLEHLRSGLGFSLAAAAINLGVARVLFRAGRRHESVALRADAQHLMTDVWTSAVVWAGVVLVGLTGWDWLDPVMGLALSLHILMIGGKLLRQAGLGLMDTGLPADELAVVQEVLDRYRQEGIHHHALRTRQAGARRFMSVHLLVPGAWTVEAAHTKAEEIENALRKRLPRLTVVTHLEPLEDPASWHDVGLDHDPDAMVAQKKSDPASEAPR